MNRFHRLLLQGVGLAAASFIAACGGGGSSGPAPTTAVSGAVIKGPVSGASVCAFKAVAAGKGDPLGCTTSNSTGGYTLGIAFMGDVVIEASGGTYVDEATGATKTLADPMQVVIASQGGTATGIVTPLTSVAYHLSAGTAGGVSSASFAAAATQVGGQFQLGTLNIATTLPTVSGSGVDAYGQVLRAVSQYAANGGSLAAFMGWTAPATLQAAFSSAFASINGTSVNFTFDAGTGGTGGTGGIGGTGGTGGTGGNRNLVITVNVMGAVSTINAGSVPVPATQAEFCSDLQADTTFSQIGAAGGGTLTINSCSFSGSTGTIQATLSITSPFASTIPYTVTYAYQ